MWEVEYTDTFGSWWDEFSPEEQERIVAAVELLGRADLRLVVLSWTRCKALAIQT